MHEVSPFEQRPEGDLGKKNDVDRYLSEECIRKRKQQMQRHLRWMVPVGLMKNY